jgi:hypothetical protein
MSDERPPFKFSPNDVEALEEIIMQYEDGDCDRNSVITALLTGIVSICVAQKLTPDSDLIIPYIKRLDAYERERRRNRRGRESGTGNRGRKRYSEVCRNYNSGCCRLGSDCNYQHTCLNCHCIAHPAYECPEKH